MDRESALKKFEDEMAEIIKEYKKELIKFRIKNNEKLILDTKSNINDIIERFNKSNENEIYFINFSLLRTSLLENKFEYLLSFNGNHIFYKELYYSEKIAFPYLFDYIFSLKKILENESKKYQGIIKLGDIDRFIQKKIFIFQEFINNLLGEVVGNLYRQEDSNLLKLKQNDEMKILIGEYHEIPLELIVNRED